MERSTMRMFPAALMALLVGCATDADGTDTGADVGTQEAAVDSTCFILDGSHGGGFLIGSRTDYYTLDSKIHLGSTEWGAETQNAPIIAQGRSIDGTGASYTTLYFANNPGESGAYVIVGGEQQYWPLDGSSRIAKDASWGISSGAGVSSVDAGIDTLAYYPAWGWGGSRVIFYVKRAQDNPCAGDQVWGGYSLSRDLQGKQGWTQNEFWGLPLGTPQAWLGTGQSWSFQYGWGQSVYYLYVGNGNHTTLPGY